MSVGRLQSSVQYLSHAATACTYRRFFRTGSDDFRERLARQIGGRFAQTVAGQKRIRRRLKKSKYIRK